MFKDRLTPPPSSMDENRMVPRPGEWPKVRLMGT